LTIIKRSGSLPEILVETSLRILVIGKNGQVASEFARIKWPDAFTVTQVGRAECDLSNPSCIGDVVETARPDLVINAAAYTAVDRAESEPDLAMTVNAQAPGEMARACAKRGVPFIHFSTDYVFDGTKTAPYVESDPVHPVSVYGATKEAGEAAIRAALDQHVIMRTSWVFAGHGANFVKTMLRLASSRPELRVVADQKGAPTAAADIAQAAADVARAAQEGRAVWGTFHFTSADPTTWHGFAEAIVEEALPESARPKVTPITTADYPTPARRPANSVLDCARIGSAYGIAQPSWRVALKKALAELAVNPA
jgi:dTDP-4-dehydrorhamnose reductase